MINKLTKWSTLEDLLRLRGNSWQLRTFISHPVDPGYNVSVFTTQGNRLGFYEKLGEYEARPSYRWERLHHDEEIKMKLKMDIIVLKRRDLGPIQIHLSTFDHFQTTERRLLPVLQFSKASLGGNIIIITNPLLIFSTILIITSIIIIVGIITITVVINTTTSSPLDKRHQYYPNCRSE